MQIRFGSRKKIQFTDKTHPVSGIFSVIIGVAALAGLVTLCLLSGSAKGNSGMVVGVFGLVVLAASVIGFILAAKCYKKDEIYMATPAIGTVVNGLLILICVLLYVIGAV